MAAALRLRATRTIVGEKSNPGDVPFVGKSCQSLDGRTWSKADFKNMIRGLNGEQ